MEILSALGLFLTHLIAIIIQPLSLVNPATRIFWPFLISSTLFILWVLWQQKNLNTQMIKKTFFNHRYWFHPSSLQDVFWLSSNTLIKTFIFLPFLASHVTGSLIIARALQNTVGDSPDIHLSTTTVMVLFSLSYFLLSDFSRFILHYTMHKFPFLWKMHKVHHSATVLTPLTVYRIHPLEMLLYNLRLLLVMSCLAGFFAWFFRGHISGLSILSVDAAGFIFNFIAANLRHSHIPLSFGRLEHIFISPAQHQIHHSNKITDHDKNFGTCLALWDKLFHSWRPAKATQKITFGLS